MKTLLVLGVALIGVSSQGCRGGISKEPPIHLVPDMDFQPKLKAQSESEFANWREQDGGKFARGMRLPVAGTVARGSLRMASLEVYKNADGSYVTSNRVPRDADTLARGRQRFNIICSVCHGRAGSGGMVARRWPIKVPDIAKPDPVQQPPDRIMALKEGQLFEIITNGKGTMPAYGHMVPPEDRWAIIHYLRALQLHFKG